MKIKLNTIINNERIKINEKKMLKNKLNFKLFWQKGYTIKTRHL